MHKKNLNKVMTKCIDVVRMDPNTFIRDQSCMDRVLKRNPLGSADKMIMFRDSMMNYSQTLLMGMDFDFMMLHVCILTFIEAVCHDS